MSYLSQGTIGLILGIVLVFAILGILLVIFSIIMLVYGMSQMLPGTQPGRCGLWGHDWRNPVPGLPPGMACRNCLVRKDGSLMAWRYLPPAIPTVFVPYLGLFVPLNAIAYGRKRAARFVILADDARMPQFALIAGAPFAPPPPPPPQVQMAVVVPQARPPAPPSMPAAAGAEALCAACFGIVPAGSVQCASCGAPRD